MENETSADVMTFFSSSLDFAWKMGHFRIFFSFFLVNRSFFFQLIAIFFFHFFVDSWLDSVMLLIAFNSMMSERITEQISFVLRSSSVICDLPEYRRIVTIETKTFPICF